jgi:hypothetical protein
MSQRINAIALLLLAATGCSQGDKKPRLKEQAVVGVWANDSAPAADGSVRAYRLRIDASGMAELVTTPRSGQAITERGTWDGADSLVRVIVRDASAPSRASSLLFAIRGRTSLGLVNFDTSAFGPAGLTLTRRPLDANTR